MVSKPLGSRSSQGKRQPEQPGSAAAVGRSVDVVDRAVDRAANPAHLDQGATGRSTGASAAASGDGRVTMPIRAGHSHTMPVSLSGHVPAPSKSGKGATVKGGASGSGQRSGLQTLPNHGSAGGASAMSQGGAGNGGRSGQGRVGDQRQGSAASTQQQQQQRGATCQRSPHHAGASHSRHSPPHSATSAMSQPSIHQSSSARAGEGNLSQVSNRPGRGAEGGHHHHRAGTSPGSIVSKVEVHKEKITHHTHRPKEHHTNHSPTRRPHGAHTLPGGATVTTSASAHFSPAASAPAHAVASSSHNQIVPTASPSTSPGSKPLGKDMRERYIRHAQHKHQTLPPSGGTVAATGSNGGSSAARTVRAHVHNPPSHSKTNPRPVPSRPPAPVSSDHPTSTTLPSSAYRTSSSHSTTNPDRPSASVSAVPSGSRERDIARITVDARAALSRQTANNNSNPGTSSARNNSSLGASNAQSSMVLTNKNNGFSSEAGASGASVSRNQTVPPPSQQPPAYSVNNESNHRNLPAYSAVANAHVVPTRTSPMRTVDPSSLRLDMLDAEHCAGVNGNIVITNQLNTGISYGRPERPETTEALPDILNSHILPPYTVRQNQHRPARQNHNRAGNGNSTSGAGGQRSRSSRRSGGQVRSSGITQLDEEDKGCCTHEGCLQCITVVTTFRWVLVSLALLGVLCVITGIVLGALHMTVGSSFLTLSLMFIGLGVMLVVVVGVGWKCTPQGHEPCHLLFNLGDHCSRDVRPTSHRRHRDRNNWYGGVTYPEFRNRRPPPSYNASMQEFQQQLMLAQLQLNTDNAALPPGVSDDNYSLPSSPPPSYKSRASTIRPGLHITFPPQGDNSQPPTYRSRSATSTRPALYLGNNNTEGGLDNPACSDTDAPGSETEASSSSSSGSAESSLSSSRASPAQSLPDGSPRDSNLPAPDTMSTLHRADQVVGYLDDVLQTHDHTLEYDRSSSNNNGGNTAEFNTRGQQQRDNNVVLPSSGQNNKNVLPSRDRVISHTTLVPNPVTVPRPSTVSTDGTSVTLGSTVPRTESSGLATAAHIPSLTVPRTQTKPPIDTNSKLGPITTGAKVVVHVDSGALSPRGSLDSVLTSSQDETDRIQDTQL